LTYRFLDNELGKPLSILPSVGFKRKFLYISYGYEHQFNETQQFSNGSHMITIGIDFINHPSTSRCTNKNYGLTK